MPVQTTFKENVVEVLKDVGLLPQNWTPKKAKAERKGEKKKEEKKPQK